MERGMEKSGQNMGVMQSRTAHWVSRGCSVSLFSPIKLGQKTVYLISIRKKNATGSYLFFKVSFFFREDCFFLFSFAFLLICNVLFYTLLLQGDQCVVLNPSRNISSGTWCYQYLSVFAWWLWRPRQSKNAH